MVATVQSHGKGDKVTDRQIPPPQALSASGHPSSALHGNQGHQHRRRVSATTRHQDFREIQSWHIKRQAAVPRTAAIQSPNDSVIKKFGGEQVVAGNIIVRQRGTVYRAGDNVGTGTDYTLFAKADGKVQFRKRGVEQHTFVSVITE